MALKDLVIPQLGQEIPITCLNKQGIGISKINRAVKNTINITNIIILFNLFILTI